MQQEIIALARQTATARGLDDSLVCAVAEQESGWNPWAYRYEDGFYQKYVSPLTGLSDTERRGRAISWGLLQILGEVARELGFANTFLASLCEPAVGLEWGCRKLKRCVDLRGGDVSAALLMYNGGANASYATEVLARQPKYVIQGAL